METMNGDHRFCQSFDQFLVYDEVARVWRERSSMARAFLVAFAFGFSRDYRQWHTQRAPFTVVSLNRTNVTGQKTPFPCEVSEVGVKIEKTW